MATAPGGKDTGPEPDHQGRQGRHPMSDIAELEARLAGAIDRMGAAYDQTQQQLLAARMRIAALEEENNALLTELDRVREAASAIIPADDALLDDLRNAAAAEAEAAERARAEAAALTNDLAAERDTVAAIGREADACRAALEGVSAELAALKARDRLEALEAGIIAEETVSRISELEQVTEQLRLVNAQLRQNNAALRRAHEAGLPDAGLVNDALRAELEAVTAARAADRAEIESILAALRPLVEETELA